MDHISILKELCTYTGVSGHEGQISLYIKDLFEKYCDNVSIDKFYNVIGLKKGEGSSCKKIMVTAHLDEIGCLVKSIDEKGFLKFANVSGIDSKILLASEVVVHGKKDINGIIGAKPPHLLKPEEARKAVKLDELSIDTGMSAEEVRKYVSIGDIVTLKASPTVLQGSKISSKSIDNRCGVMALLLAMEELQKLKFEADVYFVATTQEETHLTGVITAAYDINPDIAIVADACHGDMPDGAKDEMYALGKGPAIGLGPNLHKKITRKVMDLAKEQNIPYQVDIEPGDSGTEAWATQVSRSGIPTILISIPVRYMHTAIETVHTDDIKNAGRLIVKFISIGKVEMEESLCF